jgi:hypothetical protein
METKTNAQAASNADMLNPHLELVLGTVRTLPDPSIIVYRVRLRLRKGLQTSAF